ncbi:ABC transporter ATP-binding protein [Collinsella tanakaei]|uniref:ABC transporter ATP-binding protein n=1 Tax=Collinsella tanakaei TaxID=626935 RepID=UPI0025A49F75|nr:ABC transporter ATP-binding protein [Collinsella tanakaei]MDM8299955.1 ABC transporter ATP-binding protein [Collinsella tanakaei]
MSAMASDITSGAPLIEAHGLTKHYQDFSLQGVDLTVDEGEIVGFVGQNGAGKSTTIKALLGLTTLDGGTAHILGTDVADLARGTAAARVKEQIGVVFDTVSMPGHLRVADVGRVHARAFGQWSQHLFDQLVREFGLGPNKQVKDLSRGMGMKLSLACALSHGARLLVLDEATAGLDPMARDEILDRLRAFVEEPGRAVLMSSHITSDLEKIADRVLCIESGRIVFDLAKDEITDEMGIARCRVADFEAIAASGIIPERELRYRRHDYGIDLLVPDRFAFARQFPNIPVDHMTIDDYMALTLKGGVR